MNVRGRGYICNTSGYIQNKKYHGQTKEKPCSKGQWYPSIHPSIFWQVNDHLQCPLSVRLFATFECLTGSSMWFSKPFSFSLRFPVSQHSLFGGRVASSSTWSSLFEILHWRISLFLRIKKDQCSGKLSKQLAYLISISNIITWNISTPLPVDSPAWAYLSSLSVDTVPVNWTVPWDPIGWHLNLHLLVVANDFICSWSYFRVHFALLPFCKWKLEPIPGFTGREVAYTIDGLTLFSYNSFLNRQLKCHLCLLCLAELKITFQLAA